MRRCPRSRSRRTRRRSSRATWRAPASRRLAQDRQPRHPVQRRRQARLRHARRQRRALRQAAGRDLRRGGAEGDRGRARPARRDHQRPRARCLAGGPGGQARRCLHSTPPRPRTRPPRARPWPPPSTWRKRSTTRPRRCSRCAPRPMPRWPRPSATSTRCWPLRGGQQPDRQRDTPGRGCHRPPRSARPDPDQHRPGGRRPHGDARRQRHGGLHRQRRHPVRRQGAQGDSTHPYLHGGDTGNAVYVDGVPITGNSGPMLAARGT